MKKLMIMICALLLTLTACVEDSPLTTLPPAPGGNFPNAPKLIMNGEELDVYTSHYFLYEDCIQIPLTAFLSSVGAEFADSPLVDYQVTAYELKGQRFILNGDKHLFMTEDDYVAFLQELELAGKVLSREHAADRGLFPSSECKYREHDPKDDYTGWGGIWVDNVSLMNALRECGIDITIEYDYSGRTLTVTLP